MDNFWPKLGSAIAAAIFGYVFVSLPKIWSKQKTWLQMAAHLGMAAMVGLCSYSLMTIFWPQASAPMLCSVASMTGAACEILVPKITSFFGLAADRVGETLLNQIGDEPQSEEKEQPEK